MTISISRTLTIQLSPEESDRLEQAAHRFNLAPDAFVQQIVSERLAILSPPRLSPLQALEKLRELGQKLPPVDAVQIVRESRNELLDRGLI
jgi:hypothetical protein